jgi:hypothetical protein
VKRPEASATRRDRGLVLEVDTRSALASSEPVFYAAGVRAFLSLSVILLAALVACTGRAPSGGTSSGSGGAGGEGGACPMGPQAMLDVTIKATDGPLPISTTIEVSWSAGVEPTFVLAQPSTWKTIEQANIVCDIDMTKPPPKDLPELVCHLWTTGATAVVVKAKGYQVFEKTYTSTYSEHCMALVPSAVSIDISPAPQGTGGSE